MKEFRNWFRHMTAVLLCLVLLAGICGVPALSETTAATPTDLTEAEEPAPQPDQPDQPETEAPAPLPETEEPAPLPEAEEPAPKQETEEPLPPETAEAYTQTETVDGIRITVSADAGVIPADAALSVETAGDADFVRTAEAALGSASGGEVILHLAQYRFSCKGINGAVRIKLEHLPLSALPEQYPGMDLCVFVMQYDPDDSSAGPVSATTDISRNTVAFTLTEPGLYAVIAVMQPSPETREEPAGQDPEEQSGPEAEPEQPEQQAAPSEPETLPEETVPAPETPDELSGAGAGMVEEQGVLPAEDPLPTDSISAFVIRCYRLILGREPDGDGVRYWAGKLKSRQQSAAEVISGFLDSTEFSRMRKSPEELVDILYQAMMDRQPESAGKKYWLSLIMDGASVAELVNGFCGSQEFKNICAGFGIESGSVPEKGSSAPSVYTPGMIHFVTRCYRIALDREPDDAGLAFWCKQVMSKKSTYKDVAEGFVFSWEMNNKNLSNDAFVRKLYLLYLDREAEPAGLQYWVDQLNSGMTRKDVNKNFAASLEFKTLMASYELESTHLIIPGDTALTIKNGGKTQLQISPDLAPAGTALTWTSSDEKIITVSQEGNLFGVYPGQAKLTVAKSSGEPVAELVITVQANYRALLFSESTYGKEGTFYRNRGDVRVMKNALSSVTGPDGGEYVMHTFDNLTADEIYEKITDYLIAPSRDGDVSMFFMASHGDYRASDPVYAGRLRCKDRETNVLLPVLAEKLTHVEGKVIVILQACGPGAAVKDWEAEEAEVEVNTASRHQTEADESAAYEQGMSRAIISAFSAADPGLTAYQSEVLDEGYTLSQSSGAPKNKFLTSKFIVMTCSDYMQMSYFMQANTNNIYPYWMSEGIGTSGPMPADVYYGNNNGELTVSELHRYVYDHVKHKQTPRVYPEDSSYVLFKRAP